MEDVDTPEEHAATIPTDAEYSDMIVEDKPERDDCGMDHDDRYITSARS